MITMLIAWVCNVFFFIFALFGYWEHEEPIEYVFDPIVKNRLFACLDTVNDIIIASSHVVEDNNSQWKV